MVADNVEGYDEDDDNNNEEPQTDNISILNNNQPQSQPDLGESSFFFFCNYLFK